VRRRPTAGVTGLDTRVWAAHADAWQAEGRLREPRGGGVAELPGVRLMASGLPHAQWNSGDVTDPALVDLDRVRAWYAGRAQGGGVPWGLRVPAGVAVRDGRLLFRKRCMALLPDRLSAVKTPPRVEIRIAGSTDVDVVARVDATAFGDPVARTRPWIEPHLGAPGFTVALAALDSEPAGVATAILTDDRAGRSVGIFGVAVLEHARNRGIGGALTSWLLERGFAAGAALAHLNPDTEAAARLYARLGFVETAGLDVYVDVYAS
jgi:ribosomal protein S18 acetylase RimI-like enzyme